jgi:hypothetical protein
VAESDEAESLVWVTHRFARTDVPRSESDEAAGVLIASCQVRARVSLVAGPLSCFCVRLVPASRDWMNLPELRTVEVAEIALRWDVTD